MEISGHLWLFPLRTIGAAWKGGVSMLLAALCHKSFMFTIRSLSVQVSLQPQSLAGKELQDLDYCTSELSCRV